MTVGSASALSKILSMRFVVGYLGEKNRFGWWGSGFFEPTARSFLEPVFPKTLQLAQYHGVVEAARRVHDESLSAGSFHLFRFTEEIEQDLHDLVKSNAASPQITDQATAMDALKGLAGAIAVRHEGVGPILIGKIADFPSKGIIGATAATYLSAFNGGRRAFPYLSGAE